MSKHSHAPAPGLAPLPLGSATPSISAAAQEFAQQIQDLGVTVRVFRETEAFNAWGYYDHKTRTVFINEKLAFIQARSTLAHELAHAQHGHTGPHEHQEREAQATAAEQLIGSPSTLEATAQGLNIGGALTIALGILPRDLKRYIEENREEATQAIMNAVMNASWDPAPKPSEYRRQHQPTEFDRMTEQATA